MSNGISIQVGQVLKPLEKGIFSSSRLVRWCAAQQNWDKIHYDESYAKKYARLPERVINGALKQHFLAQFLAQSFGPEVYIPRLTYNFMAPDIVNEALEVRGRITKLESVAGQRLVYVDMEIWNVQQRKGNTHASAVIVDGNFYPLEKSEEDPLFSARIAPNKLEAKLDPSVPKYINELIGTEIECIKSQYPLDLSRLRLFADALGDCSPIHYDRKAGESSAYGTVVASPLFPIHGLEALPGSLILLSDPSAMGREAVNEIGRNFSRRFGFPSSGMVNGGNDVEIFSLLKLGETLNASSELISAEIKEGKSGKMLVTVTSNSYFTEANRVLLKERQTIIYRNFENILGEH